MKEPSNVAQARAELEAEIARRDALTDYDDPAFEEAEHQFDESPERKKVNDLLSDLLDKVGKRARSARSCWSWTAPSPTSYREPRSTYSAAL